MQRAHNIMAEEIALKEKTSGSSASATTNGDDAKKYQGLLEKKWTSVIRLQKKVFPHLSLANNLSYINR
jgi:hypothetical protein